MLAWLIHILCINHKFRTDYFQDPQGFKSITIGSGQQAFKPRRHITFGGEVVNLSRMRLPNNPDHVDAGGEIAAMQHQTPIAPMGILMEMINSIGVEAAGASPDAMQLLAHFHL